MKIVKEGDFSLNDQTIKEIKRKYSVDMAKKLLLQYIESIL